MIPIKQFYLYFYKKLIFNIFINMNNIVLKKMNRNIYSMIYDSNIYDNTIIKSLNMNILKKLGVDDLGILSL